MLTSIIVALTMGITFTFIMFSQKGIVRTINQSALTISIAVAAFCLHAPLWVVLSLVVCGIADAALTKNFVVGMGLFSVAYLTLGIVSSVDQFNSTFIVIPAFLSLFIAGFIGIAVVPSLEKSMRPLLVGYLSLVLLPCLFLALNKLNTNPLTSLAFLLIVISDGILGCQIAEDAKKDKSETKLKWYGYLVMVTYWAGLALVAFSM